MAYNLKIVLHHCQPACRCCRRPRADMAFVPAFYWYRNAVKKFGTPEAALLSLTLAACAERSPIFLSCAHLLCFGYI